LKKIAIISSHPIQYNAPLFALIAKEAEIELKVFYTWGEDSIKEKFDPDFQQHIKWDIPLLEGYKYQFLKNTSKHPGSHHFKGIINLDLNNEIEKWGADIVWVWGWSFESHLKALRFFKGKKEVWFRGDSTLLDESSGFGIKKIIRRVFLTWVYRHVDKAFYVGTHNKAYFMKHGLKANQLIYAPHAVDNNRFTDPTGKHRKQAKEIRIQLGIPEKRKLLLYVGKFEPNKNLMELINAINDTDFNLLLVGNGPEEKILKQSASENIFFMPFQNQSNMPIIYRVGDALVLNSKSETWGLAINEALACGIPVIASNKCGGAIDLLD
jgi:glycosyltransferase involved in cell wall biosynthesis